jgi:hypothetical protein
MASEENNNNYSIKTFFMKRFIYGSFAAIIALVAVAFTNAPSSEMKQTGNPTDYYYQFTGTHGQENQMSKWVQLSTLGDYNDFDCPTGSDEGCKIVNTTNSGGHPTSVPLTGAGLPNPTASPNVAAQNRDN